MNKKLKSCSWDEWRTLPSTLSRGPKTVIYRTTDLKWKIGSGFGDKIEEGFTDEQVAIIYDEDFAKKIVGILNKEINHD